MMKKITLFYVSFLFACIFFPRISHAQTITDGEYVIYSAVNDENMTATDSPNYAAHMTPPNEQDEQQIWIFTNQDYGIYHIQNKATGKYMGIKDNWCGDYAEAWVKYSETDNNIDFRLEENYANDTYVFQLALGESCAYSTNDPVKGFQIRDGSIGGEIQTYISDLSNVNQQFEIKPSTLSIDNVTQDFAFIGYFKADQSLHVDFSKPQTNGTQVQLFDITGRSIKTFKNDQISPNKNRFDLGTMDTGIYFVHVSATATNHRVVKKIIVQ